MHQCGEGHPSTAADGAADRSVQRGAARAASPPAEAGELHRMALLDATADRASTPSTPPGTGEAMVHDPWTFDERILPSAESLDGFDVWANDGDIGKVEEHAVVPGASYVVVDTASWAFGSKRVVPAGVIDEIDYDERRVHLRMCKAQVRSAPDPGESRQGDWYRIAARDYFDRYVC